MFDFGRENHLKSKIDIDQLFLNGNVIKSSSIRLVFQVLENHNSENVQVLISVPKRRFKLAVDRNRIRRLISESYRLNAAELKMVANQKNYHLNVAFIYTGKPNPPFGSIQQSVKKVLAKLINEITA